MTALPHTCEFSSPERTGCVYGCESQSCKACIYLYKTPTRSILTFSRADCRLLVSLCLHNEWENCFINPICWQSKRWFSSRSFRFPDIMLWCHQFSWWLRTPSESNKKKQEPEPDHNSNSNNDSKRLLKIENNSSLINVPSKITTFIQEKNVTQKIHRYLWQE